LAWQGILATPKGNYELKIKLLLLNYLFPFVEARESNFFSFKIFILPPGLAAAPPPRGPAALLFERVTNVDNSKSFV
jgi:hypothetical protein